MNPYYNKFYLFLTVCLASLTLPSIFPMPALPLEKQPLIFVSTHPSVPLQLLFPSLHIGFLLSHRKLLLLVFWSALLFNPWDPGHVLWISSQEL